MTEHMIGAKIAAVTSLSAVYEKRTILDPNFLKERLIARGFSPTGFNNYVVSPWQYYFRTLLQLPDAPELPMLFGTAVHAGLKAFTDSVKRGEKDAEKAISALRAELARLPLAPLDRDELMKKGEEAIRAYLAQEGTGFESVYESEFPITALITVPGVGDIPISGKIDRLDKNADGSVTVIDYKTGKAKSENEIRGLTKSSDGGYYRQLVFYKLLLNKDGRYVMSEAALHFVEPNEKGKCTVRSFAISDEDVAALEAELIKAAQAIADGSAFTSVCDPETCSYCDLVGFLIES